MAYQVLIAESAIEDLRELVEFIAQDDPIAAERLGNKLINHALSLTSFPKRHPFYDQARNIRKMAVRPYFDLLFLRRGDEHREHYPPLA